MFSESVSLLLSVSNLQWYEKKKKLQNKAKTTLKGLTLTWEGFGVFNFLLQRA